MGGQLERKSKTVTIHSQVLAVTVYIFHSYFRRLINDNQIDTEDTRLMDFFSAHIISFPDEGGVVDNHQ